MACQGGQATLDTFCCAPNFSGGPGQSISGGLESAKKKKRWACLPTFFFLIVSAGGEAAGGRAVREVWAAGVGKQGHEDKAMIGPRRRREACAEQRFAGAWELCDEFGPRW